MAVARRGKDDLVIDLELRDLASQELKRFEGRVVRVGGRTEREFERVGRSITKVGTVAGASLGPVPTFLTSIARTATSILSPMGLAAGAVAGLALVARKGLRDAKEFGRAMAEVGTILDPTTASLSRLSDQVLELAKAQGTNETVLARGLYQTLSAGISDSAEAMTFLAQANKLAVAGLADTRATVDLLTTALNAYGLSATAAGRVSDILFAAVREGKTTIPELASAFGQAAPLAATLGVSIEELTAAAATLTKGGIDTGTAFIQLRQVMANLLKPTKEARETLEKYGIDVSKARIQSEGFASVLRELQVKLGDNEQELAKVFENVRALTPIFALTGKQADEFRRVLDKLNNSAGETDQAFRVIKNESSRQLADAFAAMRVATTDLFGNVLDDAAEAVTQLQRLKQANDLLEASFNAVGETVRTVSAAWKLLLTSVSDVIEVVSIATPVLDGLNQLLRDTQFLFNSISQSSQAGALGFDAAVSQTSRQAQALRDLAEAAKNAIEGVSKVVRIGDEFDLGDKLGRSLQGDVLVRPEQTVEIIPRVRIVVPDEKVRGEVERFAKEVRDILGAEELEVDVEGKLTQESLKKLLSAIDIAREDLGGLGRAFTDFSAEALTGPNGLAQAALASADLLEKVNTSFSKFLDTADSARRLETSGIAHYKDAAGELLDSLNALSVSIGDLRKGAREGLFPPDVVAGIDTLSRKVNGLRAQFFLNVGRNEFIPRDALLFSRQVPELEEKLKELGLAFEGVREAAGSTDLRPFGDAAALLVPKLDEVQIRASRVTEALSKYTPEVRNLVRLASSTSGEVRFVLDSVDVAAQTARTLIEEVARGEITVAEFLAGVADAAKQEAKALDESNKAVIESIKQKVVLDQIEGRLLTGVDAQIDKLEQQRVAQNLATAAAVAEGKLSVEAAEQRIAAIDRVTRALKERVKLEESAKKAIDARDVQVQIAGLQRDVGSALLDLGVTALRAGQQAGESFTKGLAREIEAGRRLAETEVQRLRESLAAKGADEREIELAIGLLRQRADLEEDSLRLQTASEAVSAARISNTEAEVRAMEQLVAAKVAAGEIDVSEVPRALAEEFSGLEALSRGARAALEDLARAAADDFTIGVRIASDSAQLFQRSLGTALGDVATKSSTAKEAFKNFERAVLEGLARMAADIAAERITAGFAELAAGIIPGVGGGGEGDATEQAAMDASAQIVAGATAAGSTLVEGGAGAGSAMEGGAAAAGGVLIEAGTTSGGAIQSAAAAGGGSLIEAATTTGSLIEKAMLAAGASLIAAAQEAAAILGLGGVLGGAAGSAGASAGTGAGGAAGGAPGAAFAQGGVMEGRMLGYAAIGTHIFPARGYDLGGIATTPQLAVFGEGGGAEAFVPLPDGRRIPAVVSADSNLGRLLLSLAREIRDGLETRSRLLHGLRSSQDARARDSEPLGSRTGHPPVPAVALDLGDRHIGQEAEAFLVPGVREPGRLRGGDGSLNNRTLLQAPSPAEIAPFQRFTPDLSTLGAAREALAGRERIRTGRGRDEGNDVTPPAPVVNISVELPSITLDGSKSGVDFEKEMREKARVIGDVIASEVESGANRGLIEAIRRIGR